MTRRTIIRSDHAGREKYFKSPSEHPPRHDIHSPRASLAGFDIVLQEIRIAQPSTTNDVPCATTATVYISPSGIKQLSITPGSSADAAQDAILPRRFLLLRHF
ncbi:hypothetical protein EVAR_3763_1 [Eumeta japonica]|uniref:Uncharacterized protein n=1 Tax=Eumeta variegata TaxID=151549 RepID=A0A4C1SSD9_EUMVA|nr:hypothetical protein EVAR_3763_1 [Eumeta japonica]